MTSLPIFQVDAFAESKFSGNPAAVVPLATWLKDKELQQIAAENNLSETAFFVKIKPGGYHLRWFTPTVEVKLCGHATMAAAFVLWEELGEMEESIHFDTLSGELIVRKQEEKIWMNFPTDEAMEYRATHDWIKVLGLEPKEAYYGKEDLMLVFESEKQIAQLLPDFEAIKRINCRGIVVTAPGEGTDFVSRFFCPAVGINEDPATGSTHTLLIPYWSKTLNKDTLSAMQISKRKGYFYGENLGLRVAIGGQANLYLRGNIYL